MSKGLKTTNNADITPHLIRHAFSTINQGNRGLGLPKEEMQDRLGHVRRDVLGRTYTHSSKELALEDHKRRVRKIALEQQAMEDEEMLVSSRKHSTPSTNYPVNSTSANSENRISEEHTLKSLAKFGFTLTGLRKHCVSIGMAFKMDGNYHYSETWANDIAKNWISKKEAYRTMKLSEKQYWHWVKQNKIQTIVIGKASLIRSADAWAGLLEKERNLA